MRLSRTVPADGNVKLARKVERGGTGARLDAVPADVCCVFVRPLTALFVRLIHRPSLSMSPSVYETPVFEFAENEPVAPQCSHRYPSNNVTSVYDCAVNSSA